jgi:hypothetical protein
MDTSGAADGDRGDATAVGSTDVNVIAADRRTTTLTGHLRAETTALPVADALLSCPRNPA